MRIRCPRRQYKSPTEKRKVVSWSLVIGAPVSFIASNYLPYSGSYHVFGLNGFLWCYFCRITEEMLCEAIFSILFFFSRGLFIYLFIYLCLWISLCPSSSRSQMNMALSSLLWPSFGCWIGPADGLNIPSIVHHFVIAYTSSWLGPSRSILILERGSMCIYTRVWTYLRERRSNEGKRYKRLSTVVLMNTASGEKRHISCWSHTVWSGERPE